VVLDVASLRLEISVLPSDAGIVPVSRFPLKSRCDIADMPDKNEGMVPSKLSLVRISFLRERSVEMLVGIVGG
jgi:hypothetical protein